MPIGFAAIGLVPQSIAIGGRIVIGINELVVGLDCDTGKTVFQYEMPTIFHDFLAADERGYLLNDETGFVCIDRNGLEKWTFLPGLIGRFEFLDGVIAGETIDGAPFQVRVREY